jgi:glutathione S-transferase
VLTVSAQSSRIKREEDAMSIELFVFPPSPRSFKVMAVARHLGLDHVLRIVDLRKGEQRSPEFAALNPNMRAPALRDGDFVLWESDAILHYLAGQKPESGLIPEDARGRLDMLRWQFWELAHWDPACAVLAYEYVVKPLVMAVGEPDMAEIAKGTEAFHRVAKVLDGQLKGKEFVTGSTLTLADFSLGAALNLAAMAHYPLDPYTEIKRWFNALSALPSWRETLEKCAAPDPLAA